MFERIGKLTKKDDTFSTYEDEHTYEDGESFSSSVLSPNKQKQQWPILILASVGERWPQRLPCIDMKMEGPIMHIVGS